MEAYVQFLITVLSSPVHFDCIQKLYKIKLCNVLLSSLSRVRLGATLQPAAHQAPPSLGFSRQTGVGCHFLLQCMKVKSESEVSQSCPTLSDPMDYSPPGSSVHGVFQERVLEWGAIAFSIKLCIVAFNYQNSTETVFLARCFGHKFTVKSTYNQLSFNVIFCLFVCFQLVSCV